MREVCSKEGINGRLGRVVIFSWAARDVCEGVIGSWGCLVDPVKGEQQNQFLQFWKIKLKLQLQRFSLSLHDTTEYRLEKHGLSLNTPHSNLPLVSNNPALPLTLLATLLLPNFRKSQQQRNGQQPLPAACVKIER